MVTFTGEVFDGKLYFLSSGNINRGITVRRNNNEKSKNSGKSLLVVKQNPGNQTIFARKALTDDFHKDGCNIKTFCDSIPKATMIKELNQYTDNRNAQL